MSSTDYERTVHAAVGETHSKFSLAEALALDIAPRRGRPAHGETSTDRHLAEAREEIIDAGGEPRSLSTLKSYRQTALWVKNPKTGSFRWIRDRSWSAHDEARQRGLTYGEFAAMPKVRVEVIREVAQQLPAVPVATRAAAQEAAPVFFLPPAEPGQDVLEGFPETPAVTVPAQRNGTAPPPKRQPYRRLNIGLALRSVHRSAERIAAEVAVHGIPASQRDTVIQEVTWLTTMMDNILKQAKKSSQVA